METINRGHTARKINTLVKSESKKAELIRFGLVGAVATGIQYGVYVVFVNAVKVPAVVSTLISYAISFIFNFFLSSYFTFHSDPNAKKGLAFTLSHLVNMGMQTGFVAIFKGIVGPTLALLPAMAICVPINFFLVRFAFTAKIFQSKKDREEKAIDRSEVNVSESGE
ncbi:MAG: GtrA family protein [Bacteroidales bacterium]|nr:GtrA family protein [Bacteroidales bacterium]MDE7466632.1 GtrA family protein [Muribaculaceae bacterium]